MPIVSSMSSSASEGSVVASALLTEATAGKGVREEGEAEADMPTGCPVTAPGAVPGGAGCGARPLAASSASSASRRSSKRPCWRRTCQSTHPSAASSAPAMSNPRAIRSSPLLLVLPSSQTGEPVMVIVVTRASPRASSASAARHTPRPALQVGRVLGGRLPFEREGSLPPVGHPFHRGWSTCLRSSHLPPPVRLLQNSTHLLHVIPLPASGLHATP